MFSFIKQFFLSPKTSIIVLAIAVVVFFAGSFVPQVTDRNSDFISNLQNDPSPFYQVLDLVGLNRIYSTQWFFFLVIFFVVLLSYAVFLQAQKIIKRQKKGVRSWGIFLFHFGMVVAVTAALFTAGFQKRGFLHLIEGEPYKGDEASLVIGEMGSFAGSFSPGFTVRLTKFDISRWQDGRLKELLSQIEVWHPDGQKELLTLGTNRSKIIDGVRLYQSKKYGYTLSFLFKSKTGDISNTLVNIGLPDDSDKAVQAETTIPLTPYDIGIEFYPDNIGQTYNLSKPVTRLTISKGEEDLYNDLLFPKQTINLPNGEKFGFSGVRYWSGIRLVEDRGAFWVFSGFWLMVAGLFFMYILPGAKCPD